MVEIVPPVAIDSPCINVCRIDPATRRCTGCRRTLDEIARWTAMSTAERGKVMAELPHRDARHRPN